SPRFGRRRSWIVPMQAGLALSCLAAAFVPVSTGLGLLLGLVFLMNLFAATQDIAVDGLAVDLLSDRELGPGNAAQVVGYKLGILTSSGALLWATAFIGWRGLFLSMAAITGAVLVVSLTYRETPPGAGAVGPARERQTLKDVLSTLVRTLRLPGTPWLLAFIACYKIGEQMFTSMFKPFLVDAGFSPSRIGLWVGTYGMVFSIAGSLAGGWLAARMKLVRAVGIAALLRALPLVGAWLLTFEKVPPELHIIAVTCTEHFFAGVLTTSMFAFMMSRVDRSIGATHFTLLASVEVLGKSLGSMPSGFITGRYGYGTVFLLAWVLSVAYLALLWPKLSRTSEPPAVHAGA
ncbi:MAG TPA: MFS transporter, partial [Myxococcaceae bacterium]|nr:MFS transporter [Myxococcaceae bacterium]